ncbi:fibronectin type III domain-containing protein, partial [Gammaproteobacteria bacterium]|nr:fibronectin type III domain-containing protein [Gammaproteobacteria bacterium]
MSQRYQGGFITASYNGLKVPNAPTIGTATGGNATASVTFTAPSNIGGGAITGYTVISSPSGITGTGTSSPITVSGLTNGTAYTFTVVATNAYGTGPASAASNSVTPINAPTAVELLVVAGGAGGGFDNGGGGGAGGFRTRSSENLTSSPITVTVGAGGAGGTSGLN